MQQSSDIIDMAQHDGRPSWAQLFFDIARLVSRRSKDPHTKVGAVLVKDGRVIGIGYNGEPRGFKHEFDWNTSEKYDYVIHAELNAIANANAIGVCCKDADLYVTMSPCKDCVKLLIQHQIRSVHFLERYKDYDKAKLIADNSNLRLIERC